MRARALFREEGRDNQRVFKNEFCAVLVIGADGSVSLAALRWLADQNAAFVMLERDGTVPVTTRPVRPSDARLRRAQALSSQSETAIISTLAALLGILEPYAADIRAGRRRPHPRHWEALARLARISAEHGLK